MHSRNNTEGKWNRFAIRYAKSIDVDRSIKSIAYAHGSGAAVPIHFQCYLREIATLK